MAIFGWDISTNIIGCARFEDDPFYDKNIGKLLGVSYCDLRKVEGFFAKADRAREFVKAVCVHARPNKHFVEDRLGNFAAGRSMLQVLMKLAAFNAIVSQMIHEEDSPSSVTYIHPSTWKAAMRRKGLIIPKGSDQKKELTLEFVRRLEPTFPVEFNRNDKPQPWCYDMADAWCVGKAGCLKCMDENESSEL